MADEVKVVGLKEIEEAFLRLEQSPETAALERKALRAAGAVIFAELEAVTPVRTDPVYGRSLPAGAAKAAIRRRVTVPKDGATPTVTVDFGKQLTWIMHIVDIGHIDAANGGRTHTPAHPFVDAAAAVSLPKAADVYIETMTAGINKILEGK